MSYVNKFDTTGECAVQGQNAEKSFKDILALDGYPVREATFKEQMTHVDFIVNQNNTNIRYEVKARKKISRQDDNCQDELVWIEIQNVRGDLGWLFGAADYIVFERDKDFLVVEREKLADFVKTNCNLRKQVYRGADALYSRYQRKGRKDCLTLIKNSDVESLAKRIIVK